jgi:hypothetical protein
MAMKWTVMVIGFVMFLGGMFGRDYLVTQEAVGAFQASVAFARAHPAAIQDNKFEEVFTQERLVRHSESRLPRTGVSVAFFTGVILLAWPAFGRVRAYAKQ